MNEVSDECENRMMCECVLSLYERVKRALAFFQKNCLKIAINVGILRSF